jgi:hypothetical protein
MFAVLAALTLRVFYFKGEASLTLRGLYFLGEAPHIRSKPIFSARVSLSFYLHVYSSLSLFFICFSVKKCTIRIFGPSYATDTLDAPVSEILIRMLRFWILLKKLNADPNISWAKK